MGAGTLTKEAEVLRGDPRKAIFVLAVPILIAILLQNINNLVDAIWVTGLGADAMASIGFVFPLLASVISLGTGMGIGASSAIAWNIGRMDKDEANKAASQSFMLTIVLSVIITPILFIVCVPLLEYMGAGDAMAHSLDYAYPMFATSFIILFHGVMTGILRGEGAAKKSMYTLVLAAVLNIILDPIFIYSFGWGMAGAAWATVLATTIAVLLSFYWYFCTKKMYLEIRLKKFRFEAASLKRILRVGLPESIELIIMNLMNAFLIAYVVIAGGNDALAIWTAVWRLNYMLMIPAEAVAGAIIPVCAAAYGMRRFDRIKDGFNHALLRSTVVMLIISIITAIFAEPLAMMFTYGGGMETLRAGMIEFIRLCCIFLPAMSLIFISSALLQSVGKATYSMASTLIRNVALLILFAIFATSGIDDLWAVLVYAELGGAVLMGLLAIWTISSISKRAKQQNVKNESI